MWPIITVLNISREKKNLFENILLLGIIPGNGTKEPNNLDPYLGVVVDKLMELSGKKIYDAYQDCMFDFQIETMLHILDYSGVGKVLKMSGSGAIKNAFGVILEVCSYIKIEGEMMFT